MKSNVKYGRVVYCKVSKPVEHENSKRVKYFTRTYAGRRLDRASCISRKRFGDLVRQGAVDLGEVRSNLEVSQRHVNRYVTEVEC